VNRPCLEVADVVRQHVKEFQREHGRSLSFAGQRVLRDIAACRTAALGGHVQQCDSCGHQQIAYNSCRNRHCPKCQAGARAEWMACREQELLPVPYFHLVFTLPHQLGPLALQNKKVVYGLLFRAAAGTLLTVAADPRHLGAKIGFLAVLHTWGQNLMHHPHLHIVVPGGGLSPDASKWVPCKTSRRGKKFFLPVRVLSRVFRGKFIAGLKQAHAKGQLVCQGQLRTLREPGRFEQLLNHAVRTEWIVYAKRPFGGPQQVLKYLARYTHRVAISNHRLCRLEHGRVTFRYKDYADGHQPKTMTLGATEFLRRFLLHVLPRGFVRIRHYGLLSNRDRTAKLNRCRELLNVTGTNRPRDVREPQDAEPSTQDAARTYPCPECRTGQLVSIQLLPAPSELHCAGPHFLTIHRRLAVIADTS
jgi:Putative transposase/Transposase zinc-binding domain